MTLGADVRDPDQVLSEEPVRELLGAGEPVGVIFMNLLHCLWDSVTGPASRDSSKGSTSWSLGW